jgi:hypothetical protein
MKKILSLYPESPVCARVWPDLAKILARSGQDSGQIWPRFWPDLAKILAKSGQVWPESGQKNFFNFIDSNV